MVPTIHTLIGGSLGAAIVGNAEPPTPDWDKLPTELTGRRRSSCTD